MKKLSEPPAVDPPSLSKTLLNEYARLEEKRKKLNREAEAIKKRCAEIEDQVFHVVKAEGGEVRRIDRFGYELAIVTVQGYPSWIKEFTRVAGQAEVDRLKKAAPTKDKVEIRKL